MRVSAGRRCELRVGARELDGLRPGRRLAPPQCRIEIEQRVDEVASVVHRCPLDKSNLKPDAGVTKQPRLPLQPVDEGRQVAILDRAHDLLHEERLPRPGGCGPHEAQRALFAEVLDEGEAACTPIDVPAEFNVEREGIAPEGRPRRPRA